MIAAGLHARLFVVLSLGLFRARGALRLPGFCISPTRPESYGFGFWCCAELLSLY